MTFQRTEIAEEVERRSQRRQREGSDSPSEPAKKRPEKKDEGNEKRRRRQRGCIEVMTAKLRNNRAAHDQFLLLIIVVCSGWANLASRLSSLSLNTK